MSGRAAAVDWLFFNHAATVLRETPKGGSTCLIVAAGGGDVDICRLLIDHGAALDACGPRAFTALDVAAGFGHADVCGVLLQKGADPNVRDWEGATPLILSSETGSTDVCRLLLANGADVGVRDVSGKTALMTASARGHSAAAALLVAAGMGGDLQGTEHNSTEHTGDVSCSRCGGPLPEGAAFCPRCGAVVGQALPSAWQQARTNSPQTPMPSGGGTRPPLAPPPVALLGGLSHVDFSHVFAPFEAAGGKWVPTFNLLAFLIGPLWYLLKGMWLKAIVLGAASFFLILVTGGLAAFIPWLYYGLFGNWDLYLWERQGKQG